MTGPSAGGPEHRAGWRVTQYFRKTFLMTNPRPSKLLLCHGVHLGFASVLDLEKIGAFVAGQRLEKNAVRGPWLQK
jgi:hypothetical protein